MQVKILFPWGGGVKIVGIGDTQSSTSSVASCFRAHLTLDVWELGDQTLPNDGPSLPCHLCHLGHVERLPSVGRRQVLGHLRHARGQS